MYTQWSLIAIEGFCMYSTHENLFGDIPPYCAGGPVYECLANKCPYFAFCEADRTTKIEEED